MSPVTNIMKGGNQSGYRNSFPNKAFRGKVALSKTTDEVEEKHFTHHTKYDSNVPDKVE